PADEIRRALSDDLAARLGTIDVANSAYPPGVPVYRISVNVQRFESWPGKRAAVDAVWSVRSLATQAVMTCRTSVAEPIADGYDALVAGHRRALDVIATQAAAGVRAMAARRGASAAAAPAAGGKTAAAPVVPCPANPAPGGDAGATGKSGA
ncbi:PqiC family protein, partial [Burkholderia cepacia]|uniref:PqiC family protein n=1 Tax=Burkholderia cepacia TaxID=292 RepID=UPI000A3E4B8C